MSSVLFATGGNNRFNNIFQNINHNEAEVSEICDFSDHSGILPLFLPLTSYLRFFIPDTNIKQIQGRSDSTDWTCIKTAPKSESFNRFCRLFTNILKGNFPIKTGKYLNKQINV